jgi:hypothetical protein
MGNAIPKWEIFELSLASAAKYGNAFTEAWLTAEFTCGERRYEIDGFYDGEEGGKHVFRVRFAPMREGAWSYATRSNDASLRACGAFECTAPISSGGLVVNPRYANWFAREDGSGFMAYNEGWYPHAGNGKQHSFEDVDFPQPSEADIRAYYDILAEHRINMVIDIGQLYARQSEITDTSFRWPWRVTDAKANRIDKERFNLGYYQRMDRQLQYAKDRGIFFAMELLYDNSVVRPREWGHHPINIDNGGWLRGNEHGIGWDAMFDLKNETHVRYTARYVRYTVARFSAYWNLLWSVGSENGNLIRINDERLPHAFLAPEIAAEWYGYWGNFIARRDPHGRLKSYGDAGKQPLMVTSASNSFIITQDPRNYSRDDVSWYFKAMNAFGEEFWKYGRPVVIGEMTAGTNGHYDMERRLYWIGFTAGYAMGRADRHFGPVIGGKLVEIEKFGTDGIPPIYRDIRRMARFIEENGVRFWRMAPNDRLIDDGGDMIYCLAAEDEEYVIYFVRGGTARLAAPEGTSRWFNPRTGESTAPAAVEAGNVSFEAPDGDDWVLHILAGAPEKPGQ